MSYFCLFSGRDGQNHHHLGAAELLCQGEKGYGCPPAPYMVLLKQGWRELTWQSEEAPVLLLLCCGQTEVLIS